MMKGNDLEHILRAWPYEPGHITVRRILGDDDRVKIQMRLDLGVLQMEVTGRPCCIIISRGCRNIALRTGTIWALN